MNFLSHFLMTPKLLDGILEPPNLRLIMVVSVTGNNITVGGRGIYTIVNIKQLDRFTNGFDNPVGMMANGYGFIGTIQIPPLQVPQEPRTPPSPASTLAALPRLRSFGRSACGSISNSPSS